MMGVQQPVNRNEPSPDPGIVPWLDGADTCPIPGTNYSLWDTGCRCDGRRCRYLGQGSEGVVYKATSSDLSFRGCSLAVKFLRFSGPGREEQVESFLHEAPPLLHEIGSLRLARTYDIRDLRRHGPEWPPVALVMDYFPCSLRDVVEAACCWGRPLPLRLAVSWAKQIAQGLQELHELRRPIVHRDLTARNLMFRLREGRNWGGRLEDLTDATAMITDFGTVGPLGGRSGLVVYRVMEDDPWKHRDLYPFRRHEDDPPPTERQMCDPYMDIYAYGQVLHVLDSLTRGAIP